MKGFSPLPQCPLLPQFPASFKVQQSHYRIVIKLQVLGHYQKIFCGFRIVMFFYREMPGANYFFFAQVFARIMPMKHTGNIPINTINLYGSLSFIRIGIQKRIVVASKILAITNRNRFILNCSRSFSLAVL